MTLTPKHIIDETKVDAIWKQRQAWIEIRNRHRLGKWLLRKYKYERAEMAA